MTAGIRGTIDRLAFGGSGVCRVDGKVWFVPGGCPGDEVLLEAVTEKRSYVTGRILRVLSPSPDRVEPSCPHFGRCGGCAWQHVSYDRQLAEKRDILADALWRGARVPGERVGATLPSGRRCGYRSRVQFKLFRDRDRLHIGFYSGASHRVVDLPGGCPVAVPAVNEALSQLRALLQDFPDQDRIPQINIDCGDTAAVAVVNYIGASPSAAAEFFRVRRAELTSLEGLWLQTGRKSTLTRVWGGDLIRYSMPAAAGREVMLGFPPGGFSQVNLDQNRVMLGTVRSLLAPGGTGQLLDLYCGNGNFSLPLSGEVAAISGIEGYEGSIAAARENCRLNGIAHACFHCADAAAGIREFSAEGRCFDAVILDPPRSGAADAAALLPGLAPERIVYISCDPGTLARDCGILAGGGYCVETSVPVDMFPQTHHIESVTLLTKQNRGDR